MPLLDTIQKDMVAAMKAKEEARLSAIRMIKAALKKHEVDSMKPLDAESEMRVLQTLVKQRRDSIDMFRQGGREDLAAKEEAELAIVQSYMPAAATEAEMAAAIEAAVAQTGASSMKDMGTVMKAARDQLAGRTIDGKLLSDKVKARLS